VQRLAEAIKFSTIAHHGQLDKAGFPVILHPIQVMLALIKEGVGDEDLLIAAICHDLVEDTQVTLKQIHDMFGRKVGELVDVLTRRQGETYRASVERVKKNEKASLIKQADLQHNLSRSSGLPDDEREGLRSRWWNALCYLQEHNREATWTKVNAQAQYLDGEVKILIPDAEGVIREHETKCSAYKNDRDCDCKYREVRT
jgi:hypothetical protein